MKLHGNAALSLNQRRRLAKRVVEEDWSLTSAAAAAEVSEPTARKWVRRYESEGEVGLLDRPSAAHRVHNRTSEERIETICALRRLRFTGQEIRGCDEGAPRSAQVRPDDCCERRIFRAVAAGRHSEHEVLPIPQAVGAAIPSPGATPALVREPSLVRRMPASSAGPPAFLAHRALLI